jgi:hypothetical protein
MQASNMRPILPLGLARFSRIPGLKTLNPPCRVVPQQGMSEGSPNGLMGDALE